MRDRPALAERIRRIDAATPARRDRSVDALRALAILGVVIGHWLVTAVVELDRGRLDVASPLEHLPGLAPASWVFQTLAVFFLVGGYASATSYASSRRRGAGYRRWLGARLARLSRPVIGLMSVWSVATVVLLATGTDIQTVRTLLGLVVSPLWFLLVYALVTAATPLAGRLHWSWPLAVVVAVDVLRFTQTGPGWIGWVNVAAAWLVPFCLGGAWARAAITHPRRSGAGLLVAGAVALAVLVTWGGYPVSMVGVPGAEISNLNPPTLAAAAFGLAQCGAALLLAGPLRRAMVGARAWSLVVVANVAAMTVFVWHQTALLAVTIVGLPFGPLTGLHTPPDSASWLWARAGWLPVFAVALAACSFAFGSGRRVARAPRA